MLSFEKSDWLKTYMVAKTVIAPPNAPFAFPLTANSRNLTSELWESFRHLYHSLDVTLDNFPASTLLIGPPGSGKSFALKSHVGRVAAAFLRALQDDPESAESFPIPIFVDLKGYNGSLEELFPSQITLARLKKLTKSDRASFLLDSYNEVPRHYVENGRLQSDVLGWMESTPDCRWIIASRSPEGMDLFELPQLIVGDLQEDYLAQVLSERRTDLGQRHAEDLFAILRRPIFLAALLTNRMRLDPGGTHPAAAIESVVRSHSFQLREKTGLNIDLFAALGRLAVNAINTGQELMATDSVRDALVPDWKTDSKSRKAADSLLESLIESGLFSAYDDGRISLYHQSLTELLAARTVAQDIALDPNALEPILRQRHWDFSLSLVLHYLDEKSTMAAFSRILAADLPLAIKCARFSEFHPSELVTKILRSLPSVANFARHFDVHVPYLSEALPIDSTHAPLLRELLCCRDGRASIAAELLVIAIGEAAIEPILQQILLRIDDAHFGSTAGEALSKVITWAQLTQIIPRFCEATIGIDDLAAFHGARRSLSKILEGQDPDQVAEEYFRLQSPPRGVDKAFADWAEYCGDPVGWKIAVQSYLRGNTETSDLWLLLSRAPQVAELFAELDQDDIQRVISIFESDLAHNKLSSFSLEVLFYLEKHHKEYRKFLKQLEQRRNGTIRLAVLAMRGPKYREELWEEAHQIFKDRQRRFTEADYGLIGSLKDVDWTGQDELYLQLIERRDVLLANAIMTRSMTRAHFKFQRPLSWSWVAEMLPFLLEECTYDGYFRGWIMANVDDTVPRELIREFNRPGSPYREMLAVSYLDDIESLSADDLTSESIEYLIDRLHRVELHADYGNLLSSIANDEIATNLLSRLTDQSEPFHSNVKKVLNQVGKRLKKRYV